MGKFKLSSNKNYTGATLYAAASSVNVRKLAGDEPNLAASGVLRSVKAGAALGKSTGRQLVPTTGNGWMEVMDPKGATGWVRFDLLTKNAPVDVLAKGQTEQDAQRLVQEFLTRDARIARDLGGFAARIRAYELKGVPAAKLAPARAKYNALVSRLAARQKKVFGDKKYLKVTQTAEPVKDMFGVEKVKQWFGISGVGVLPVLGVVLVVALVAALASGLVTWYAARDHYIGDAKASEQDMRQLPTLEEHLAELDKTNPALAKKIREELNAAKSTNNAEGYAAGKSDAEKEGGTGPIAEAGGLLKWGTVAFLAFKFLA